MVDFIRKRLQVFVSSTYEDLKQERQAAVEAILSAGHIPAGMELFAAGDESQMDVIKQWIDESDVYLLILGGRYGSVESKSQKSYVELEYEYALSKGKPLFACVIKEVALEDRVKVHGMSVFETENPQRLKEFRSGVLTKISRFWQDSKDIKLAVLETLNQFARREDLLGWVRPHHDANVPALADEIARLSKENSQLRDHAKAGTPEVLIEGLTLSEITALLLDKGVLDAFMQGREELMSGDCELDANAATTLERLGLIIGRYPTSDTPYRITKAGRLLLNKLDAVAALNKPATAGTG